MDVDSVDRDRLRELTPQQIEIWSAFVSGGWALMGRVNDEMSSRGLAATDMRLLEALGRIPVLGISELADTVHMRVSTVSRQIGRLIEDGDVEKIKSDGDGRHRLVRLTDQGRATLHEHVLVRDLVIRRHVIDVLSDEEFTVLGQAFRKIGEGICGRSHDL